MRSARSLAQLPLRPRTRPLARPFARVFGGACLAAIVSVSCTRDAVHPVTISAIPSPTGPDAAEPFVALAPDGRVVMSWLERAADSSVALRFAMLDSSRQVWSEPREILRRTDLFVNWADFPSVVPLADGRLLAHWLQRNGSGRYAYDVRLSESRDGGATWSESALPHAPGSGGSGVADSRGRGRVPHPSRGPVRVLAPIEAHTGAFAIAVPAGVPCSTCFAA